MASAAAARAPAAAFSRHVGAITANGDLHYEVMTVEDAKLKCMELPGCIGFTFQTDDPEVEVPGTSRVFFKNKWDLISNVKTWTTYRYEANALQLASGTKLVARGATPIYESYSSRAVVAQVKQGGCVVVKGPTELVDGVTLVPVQDVEQKASGVAEINQFAARPGASRDSGAHAAVGSGSMSAAPQLPVLQKGSHACVCGRVGLTPKTAKSLPGVLIDTTGDGIADAVGYDTTGDGVVDALDTDGDGKIDSLLKIFGERSPQESAAERAQRLQEEAAHEKSITEAARDVFQKIDLDGNGSVSKLDFLGALQRSATTHHFVLPGVDFAQVMKDDEAFDLATDLFDAISGGKKRCSQTEFVAYFEAKMEKPKEKSNAFDPAPRLPLAPAKALFEKLAADSPSGSISKLELVGALRRYPDVASQLLPELAGKLRPSATDKECFEMVDAVFAAIAGGRKYVEYSDIETYFRVHKASLPKQLDPHFDMERSMRRLLIIGPGFGREMNPGQTAILMHAGFQIEWVMNVPNPEQPGVQFMSYMGVITSAMERVRPHLLMAASKGVHYLIALWQMDLWKGPSVMINPHPSLKGTQLPQNVSIVLCQGGDDTTYIWQRPDLEKLIETGSDNKCFLYYAGGTASRAGDQHNMISLQAYDCLPRLVDAALCHKGPETHMLWSCRDRLAEARLVAEEWLGYCPHDLRRLWASDGRGGPEKNVFEVPRDSEEFTMVWNVFSSQPREQAAYAVDPAGWARLRIVKVERVENGLQEEGSAMSYFEALRMHLEAQDIAFEPGVHTRWAFHGTDAIESITTDPMTGFQPLVSGSARGVLWGSGTYFARDARYAVCGGFCRPGPDGSRQVLMCLLMTGIFCLGDPAHRGVLPFRRKPYKYNSSVDSLSNPEIFIVQHPGAAYPAYVITVR